MTLGLAALLLALALPARACECLEEPSDEAHLAQADLVFEGVAQAELGELRGGAARRFRFAKVAVIKGPAGLKTVVVGTGNGFGDCGTAFEAGAKYLVFAGAQKDKSWRTSICSYNKEWHLGGAAQAARLRKLLQDAAKARR